MTNRKLIALCFLLLVCLLSCDEDEIIQKSNIITDETDELKPDKESELEQDQIDEDTPKTLEELEAEVESSDLSEDSIKPVLPNPTPLPGLKPALSTQKLSLTIGESAKIEVVNVKGVPSSAIEWKSTQPKVASVSADGIVTALSKGKTLVTAKTAESPMSTPCLIIVKEAYKEEAGSINSAPDTPNDFTAHYVSRDFSYIIVLRWDASIDKNNDAVAYTIYEKKGSSWEKIKTVKQTELVLHDYKEKSYFKIIAVDAKGAKSRPAYTAGNSSFNMRFYAGLYFPLGSVRNIATMGVAGYVEALKPDFMLPGLYGGVKLGCITMVDKAEATDYNYILPLFLTLGYHYTIWPGFDLIPKMSAGISYNALAFEDDDGKYQEFGFVTPHFEAGVEGEHYLTELCNLYWGLLYNGIIDTSGLISGIGINAGVNCKFR